MQSIVKLGKKRTVLISFSILLVSIFTIYFYHANKPEIDTKKLVQQAVRFVLTVGLLAFLYKGKKWAVNVSIFLFSFSIIGVLIAMFSIESDSFISKMPLVVMAIVYSIALYHFGISKAYKAFKEFQSIKTKT